MGKKVENTLFPIWRDTDETFWPWFKRQVEDAGLWGEYCEAVCRTIEDKQRVERSYPPEVHREWQGVKIPPREDTDARREFAEDRILTRFNHMCRMWGLALRNETGCTKPDPWMTFTIHGPFTPMDGGVFSMIFVPNDRDREFRRMITSIESEFEKRVRIFKI